MARASERGAAFTEALAVIALFVLLWSGLMYMFHVYSKKLATKNDARAAAWQYALASCEGGAGSTESDDGAHLDDVLDDVEAGDDTGLDADGDALVDDAENVAELEFGESWGVGSASAERPGATFLTFEAGTSHSTVRVQCDEKPRGADPVSVLSFLWDLRNTVNLQ